MSSWFASLAHIVKQGICTYMQFVWKEACQSAGRDHDFWLGDSGSVSLSAPAFRVPRLLLMGLGIEHLKLIKVRDCTCISVCHVYTFVVIHA